MLDKKALKGVADVLKNPRSSPRAAIRSSALARRGQHSQTLFH